MLETLDKTFWIENYGCQMNLAEANALENDLAHMGWQQAPGEDAAQAVILNSCSVRISAENRLWSRLIHFSAMKQHRNFCLIVMGCMAERLEEDIPQRCPAVDHVVGSMAKDQIPAIIAENFGTAQAGPQSKLPAKQTGLPTPEILKQKVLKKEEYSFFKDHSSHNSVQGMIPIMHGCDNFCSYCIIPFVRGKEVSRPAAEVLAEAQQQQQKGYKDITLIGQNVNSYNHEGTDFNELLRILLRETDIPRIRFITPHPTDFGDEFIELIAGDKRICNHVHLPLQHASDRVLEDMNRGYTLQWYRSLVLRLRRAVPDVSLTADLMVGFAGETEDDLQMLLDYVEEVRYDSAFTYYYNPIPGTPAFDRDDLIPEEVQKERLYRLQQIQDRITLENLHKRVGLTEEVLVEGPSKQKSDELLCRNEYNQMVIFPIPQEIQRRNQNLTNTFVRVQTQELRGRTLWGQMLH
ncbi:tRNA (N6-isopentenyl adenosine(37)-C2)-methylthiotransferase MiaB [Candidatus Haliotispira prima]|uniref:tRNA-2-methylthio-N(6)-dimethylallyladenosine synthase n=1 Tax=Candidatus Haliotispira prima TaxID=3034016 RepID=A0ABY8MIF6_9SPIO|nr:tRNA (N6-isopentenyl adenosine(37)-C2)-methylthiotransferase MiaB [Candidatus Haliotispira prima]